MSSSPPTASAAGVRRAVFLSYAREDAAEAQALAQALLRLGIEAWFDQSELRGGDAWDQKIRRQIRECSLFVPVISRNTQARGEGYFRLEWRLAVERTHLMAEGVPFLAPVVVDGTRDQEAVVPAEFLRVQWSRIAGGAGVDAFAAQIRRMLTAPARPAAAASLVSRPSDGTGGGKGLWIAALVAALVVAGTAGYVVLRPQRPAAPSTAEAAVDPKSIAVLPFENMSVDKDNAFFADGVHEDILTNLSFVRDLHVVSRTSVMRYKGTTKSIRDIAKDLGVAFVLEGSVRREGGKVRVTGQLIDARTDEHVWAKAYDRDLTDIFAIQAELAQSIAEALKAVLSPEAKVLIARRPTENARAYDDYVRARSANKEMMGTLMPSIGFLREAVTLDPRFAVAWAELASRLAFVHFSIDSSQEILQSATDAIDTAVKLAPDDPAVIEGRGDFFYYGYRDYARAAEQYARLAELQPNSPIVYLSLALIQRRQGRWAESIANLRKAQGLDPSSTVYTMPLSECLESLRRYGEQEILLREAMKQQPDSLELGWAMGYCKFGQGSLEGIRAFASRTVPVEQQSLFIYLQSDLAFVCGDWREFFRLRGIQRYYDGNTDDPRWGQDAELAAAYAEYGDMETARARALDALVQLNEEKAKQPDNAVVWANLSTVHAILGHRAEVLDCVAIASALLPESRDALVAPGNSVICAAACAMVGEKERALSEVKRLFAVPNGMLVPTARVHFGALHGDPRFEALLADPANSAPLTGR